MDEHPNVAVIRAALEHVGKGDIDAMFALWENEFVYYGFDAEGRNRECRNRADFTEIFGIGQRLLETHENEVI
ncbi:MAG TPA: hypothetical protein PLV68_14800, partial [Ilumatobacteraceae bacterium]|nr:hypothetical protein [Ilumatobacteraceae bacterium]